MKRILLIIHIALVSIAKLYPNEKPPMYITP